VGALKKYVKSESSRAEGRNIKIYHQLQCKPTGNMSG